ncbi:hypothetical protein V495_07665 [Pseudogymnoascus sp. VKM F-4514 (FW-929)]|nr:hypothetical protein V495_07665 [Pseudogymnoascus sp. VKM F-4514 (FW-929)]
MRLIAINVCIPAGRFWAEPYTKTHKAWAYHLGKNRALECCIDQRRSLDTVEETSLPERVVLLACDDGGYTDSKTAHENVLPTAAPICHPYE